jgi:hypothetical protein
MSLRAVLGHIVTTNCSETIFILFRFKFPKLSDNRKILCFVPEHYNICVQHTPLSTQLYKITPQSRLLPDKLIVARLVENSPTFMELEDSSPCPQESTFVPCLEPDESILVLSFHLRPGIQSDVFQVLRTKFRLHRLLVKRTVVYS